MDMTRINVGELKMKNLICKNCKCEEFIHTFKVVSYKISLISIPVGAQCVGCGKKYSEYEIKTEVMCNG